MENIAFIGGDIRYFYASKDLNGRGYNSSLFYCDKIAAYDENSLNDYGILIMPLPLTRNGLILNSPLNTEKIYLNNKVFSSFENKIIFTSKSIFNESNKILDYSKNPDFIKRNAVLTADGTVELIQKKYHKDIKNKKILIIGYGNVGKACALKFKKFSDKVFISSRSISDKNKVFKDGFIFTNILYDEAVNDYDIIINTAPGMILNFEILNKVRLDSLIIDLASSPGGTDFTYAKRIGISAENALALPGKFYPEDAAKIISDTVTVMLKEAES